MCKDFCYVDMSNPDNLIKDKMQSRADNAAELDNIPNYWRVKDAKNKPKASKKTVTWRTKFDASGYVIDPNRYKEAIRNLKSKKFLSIVDEQKDKLEKCKRDIADIIIDSTDFYKDYESMIENILDQLKIAYRWFNNDVLRYCDEYGRIKDDPNISDQEKEWSKDALFKSIDNVDTKIKSCERAISKLSYAEVDW